MKRRKKSINEIKIRLLPEKAKRDYILRLVSSMIVLVFLIINIVFVYLPYNRYNNELNDLRNHNSIIKLELDWQNDKYNYLAHDIFHYEDGTIIDILSSTLNFEKILKPFLDEGKVTYKDIHDNLTIKDQINPEFDKEIRPFGSKVEYIIFSEKELKITVSVEFLNLNGAIYYENMLNNIKYVSYVESSNISPIETDDSIKYKRIFYITIDPQHITCPKVEGYR